MITIRATHASAARTRTAGGSNSSDPAGHASRPAGRPGRLSGFSGPGRRTRRHRSLALAVLLGVLLSFSTSLLPLSAASSTNSTGYTVAYNNDGKLQIVQDAYAPVGYYLSLNLNAPEDLCILDSYMYVADTGNSRVIRVNLETREAEPFGEQLFRKPTGVAADAEGRIYVADSSNNEAYRFNKDLELEQVFMKPDTPSFGLNATFKPLKVAPSTDGGVYLVNEGSVAGLVHMDRFGGFLGYFGASEVSLNPFYLLVDRILTEEQQKLYLSRTPASFSNVVRGPDKLIYSVNRGSSVGVVRHSIGGQNILKNPQAPRISNAIDLAVAEDGRILVLDDTGYVMEITADGYLICIFGGPSNTERAGLFALPTGIAIDDHSNIYVLDKEKNNIQIFKPTESQAMLHAAINAYRRGDYTDSIELLEEILRVNASSRLARTYIGKNYLQKQDYERAAEQFYISEQIADYSDAFWEIRNAWLQDHLLFVILLLALLIAWLLRRRARTKARNRAINEGRYEPGPWERLVQKHRLLYDLRMLKHGMVQPSDNAYEVSVGRTGTYGSATLIYLLSFAAILLVILGSGFIFSERVRNFSLTSFTVGFFLFLGLFILSNFFIVAIRDGKGSLRDIYLTTAYAFAPILFIFPLAALLGNTMTLNEAFIYRFLIALAVVWAVVILVTQYMQIHEYTLGKTISTILLALFTMVVVVVVTSLIWLVIQQMAQQVREMRLEVLLND